MTSILIDRIDGLSSSAAIKGPCKVATTGDIALYGEQTIDGVAVVTGDRILVRAQTAGYENGIYIVDTGQWRRSKDFSRTNDVVKGTRVSVTDGSTYAGVEFVVSTANPIVIGTSTITFSLTDSAQINVDFVSSLSSITDLSASRIVALGSVISVAGHTEIGDGGGGRFVVLANADWAYPSDNDGLAIDNATGNYVFVREEFLQDRRINLRWFGAKGDSSDQTTALNNAFAAFDAINETLMSGDLVADMSPWLYVPGGNFKSNSGITWNPKCGFPTIKGDGHNSCLQNVTVALYNDLSAEGGAQQFGTISDLKLYGNNTQDYGIVLGNPTDWGGSNEGRWGGAREGRIRNVVATNFAEAGLLVVRDNHSRIESCVFNRNVKDGILILTAVDTEFSGCHASFNSRNGVRLQPWAGNGVPADPSEGPYSGNGPGGLSWTDCNARYNGKGNFYATGGDNSTVINSSDTEAGVSDLDFFGNSTIRIGNWWESYFHNCSWANISTGNPTPTYRTMTISSIVQDTTNANEIRITTTTPHYFHRGVQYDNSQTKISGTGGLYDAIVPRSGTTFIIKEVYSTTEFALNAQYVSAFAGTGTLSVPQYDFVVRGQEKGYTNRNIRDLWFIGKNHNYSYFERCSYLYTDTTRFKLQLVLGADVIGFSRNHILGIGPDATDSDNYVPIMGDGAYKANFSQGLRQFGVTWPGWTTGTPVTADDIGYSMEFPVSVSPARTDHAAGAPRQFYGVYYRPDGMVFGRYDVQNDKYRGWRVKPDGDSVWENETQEWITIESTNGQVAFKGRVGMEESYSNTTTSFAALAVFQGSTGNLQRYTGDAIVAEGSDANGNWIKFASGAMACWSPVFTFDVTTAAGSIFRAAATQTWTFPVAFVTSNPVVTPSNGNNATTHWGTARATGLTAADIFAFAHASTTGRTVQAMAVGKWK